MKGGSGCACKSGSIAAYRTDKGHDAGRCLWLKVEGTDYSCMPGDGWAVGLGRDLKELTHARQVLTASLATILVCLKQEVMSNQPGINRELNAWHKKTQISLNPIRRFCVCQQCKSLHTSLLSSPNWQGVEGWLVFKISS